MWRLLVNHKNGAYPRLLHRLRFLLHIKGCVFDDARKADSRNWRGLSLQDESTQPLQLPEQSCVDGKAG